MQTIITCQAILFDLDGTLVDSMAMIQRLWEWWAKRRGIAFDAILKTAIGRPAVETIRIAAPHLRAEDEIEELETEEIRDMTDVILIPGALDFIARLDSAPWAIVTSGSRRVAEARINHVGLPMPRVLITGDQVAKGKPHPDAYLLAAERLGVTPDQCVVLEDAPVGIQAGKAAGMRVVAIASTHAADGLQGADALIDSLAEIEVHPDKDRIVLNLGR